MRLKNRIESIIKAAAANPGTETRYREPIVGYASTDDPIFDEMKKIIGPHHLHPKEIFLEARTVVTFFLPFEKDLVKRNWKSPDPVKEWIQARSETDYLIEEINKKVPQKCSFCSRAWYFRVSSHADHKSRVCRPLRNNTDFSRNTSYSPSC